LLGKINVRVAYLERQTSDFRSRKEIDSPEVNTVQ